MLSRSEKLFIVMIAVAAALIAEPVAANPPFPNSTYNLYANNSWVGILNIPSNGDQQGATLGAGSFVDAVCANNGGPQFTAHLDLSGIPINNPAGVINAFLGPDKITKRPSYPGSLVSPRFFMRWYPSVASAPTQSPPMGSPGGSTNFSLPSPGDIGTGSASGRNNPPSAQDQAHFCSFSLNLFAQKV
jgi:hypothetical protein